MSQPERAWPSVFVGRQRELQLLEEALVHAGTGRALTLLVHGESGQGKSALVRHFLQRLDSDPAGDPVLALSGRCYERESVPYKALDEIIDRLAQHLGTLDEKTLATLLPPDAPMLLALFPVLGHLAIAPPPHHAGETVDAHELRWRGFAALRELLVRLARARPLLLVIDDLQWADEDSIALLSELLRPPAPAPLLLIATVRASVDGRPLLAARLPGEVRALAVAPLLPADAEALVDALAAEAGEPLAHDIAVAAAGHPLFIDALVRHRLERDAAAEPVRLDEALWWRIARLPPEAQRLLELLSVSGVSLRQESVARAGGLELDAFDQLATLLRAQHLVRTSGAHHSDSIEPYHDRVRETVLSHLLAEPRRALHKRLGEVLETAGGADPEQLAVHFRQGGEPARAARYFTRAAGQARHALAFDRAARLYREALAEGPDDAQGLRVKLATALANAGRGAEAANEFQKAAEAAEESGADHLAALDLSRRAAEELLRSGRIEEGLAAIAVVLAAFGYRLPSRTFAPASLALQRAKVRWRGLEFTPRREADIPRADLQRIDICWSMSAGLAVVDAIVGADLQSRQVAPALDAGEPYRIVRAFAFEAAFQAAGSHAPRAAELLRRTEAVVKQSGDPRTKALLTTARGAAAFLQGRWREGKTLNAEAERLLRAHCPGLSWELDTARFYSLLSALHHGDLEQLFTRVPSLLREAEARGDMFAVANTKSAFTPMMRLATDDADGALDEARAALERWPRDAFAVPHYNALLSSVTANIYRARPELADELVREAWPAMKRARLLVVQHLKIRALHIRASARLALAASATENRESLLDSAASDARRLERERAEWGGALAGLLRAGVAHVHADEENAARALDGAATALDRVEMRLYAAAARRQLGRLRGGSAGQRLVSDADAFLRGQKIRNPSRFAVTLVPGF